MFCPVGSLTKMFFCIIGKFAGRRLSDYFKSKSMILITTSLRISVAVRATIIFSNFVINITSSRERRKPTIS